VDRRRDRGLTRLTGVLRDVRSPTIDAREIRFAISRAAIRPAMPAPTTITSALRAEIFGAAAA
jgi:hypothetical protein